MYMKGGNMILKGESGNSKNYKDIKQQVKNTDWFYNDLDLSQLGGYDIWVAHYTGSSDKQTDYRNKYDMWQYTSAGSIMGVYGPVQDGVARVDMNICYKNY